MSRIKLLISPCIILLCLLLFSACQKRAGTGAQTSVTDAEGKTVNVSDSSRIVSVGTANTETIYALGAGGRVVGIDNSSSEYIKEAAGLPKVGPARTLSAEGILALKPTLIIANNDAGPAEALGQIRAAGVTVLTVPANFTVETVKAKVHTIAHALNADAKGDELANSIDREMTDVSNMLARAQAKPKVLFAGRGPNQPNATMSGTGTTVAEMIKLAGGTNPITDFEGFKPMTDEAVVAAQPDILLMTEHSFERSGGIEGVLKFPGVALTPAGKNRRIVPVSDMYFQGFGPGVGKAVRELALKFHPELGGNAEGAASEGKKE